MNRYYGRNPKIGIRPTIDGRRKGVRESLEAQTMKMAENLAGFISSELKYLSYSANKLFCKLIVL